MKPKFKPRELLLMTLPIALLGGAGWWISQGGSLASLRGLPADLYTGKPRLEIGERQPLSLSSWDVAQGYGWGTRVNLWQKGTPPISSSASVNSNESFIRARVFYKRRGIWKEALTPQGQPPVNDNYKSDAQRFFGNFANKRPLSIKVNLAQVPRDAQEIRLRGYYSYMTMYTGAACKAVVSAPQWKLYPQSCIYTLQSHPFDWAIKTPMQEYPVPVVSHNSPLKLIDAKWIIDGGENYFLLQVRRRDKTLWKVDSLVVKDLHIWDEKGHPLVLGSPTAGYLAQSQFSSSRPPTDLIASFVHPDAAHDHAYEMSAKGPLKIQAKISDGECWPLIINARVPRVQMDLQDFGDPSDHS